MARKAKVESVVSVDFTGVQARKALRGAFHVNLTGGEVITSETSGEKYIKWMFTVDQGKHKGQQLRHNTSLQPQALWNLRGMLEALGYKVKDGEVELDLKKLTSGKYNCWVQVIPEATGGAIYNNITEFSAEPLGEGGESDDAAEQEITQADVMAMTAAELEELVDDNDLDVDLDEHKSLKAKRAAVWAEIESAQAEDEEEETEEEETEKEDDDEEDDDEEDDDEEDDDEEDDDEEDDDEEDDEEEEVTAEDINDMSADELKQFVKDNKLKVKLVGTLKKQRKAVIKAAGL